MKVSNMRKIYVGVKLANSLKTYLIKRAEIERSTMDSVLNGLIRREYEPLDDKRGENKLFQGETMEAIKYSNKYPAEINSVRVLKDVQYDENGWIEAAKSFYGNNVFLSKRVAMEKYKEYLDRISFIKVYYLRIHRRDYSEYGWDFIRKCENDLRQVFKMSQTDDRLTSEEKQEVVDYVAKRYTFLLSTAKY